MLPMIVHRSRQGENPLVVVAQSALLQRYIQLNAIEPFRQFNLARQTTVELFAPGIFKHIALVLMRRRQLLKPRLSHPAVTSTTGTATTALRLYAGDTIVQCGIHDRLSGIRGNRFPAAIRLYKADLYHRHSVAGIPCSQPGARMRLQPVVWL